jgi:hypothetical protein
VARIVKEAAAPMMPRIQEEMPSLAEKLNMLEINNIEIITTNLRNYFKSNNV